MNIPADKLLHLKYGTLFALMTAAAMWFAVRYGIGWATAGGSVVMGWALERYQAIRREGTPSMADAAASAAPGVVLGVALQAYLTFG